jgi:hypothetical protein
MLVVAIFLEGNGRKMLDMVYFYDNAWFHLDEHITCQNSRIWSSANPHAIGETPLKP